ncbi:hypothetical protein [Anaeropeptidivorans aminofermentans]|jgi:preprotein translocase subunit YajC|uniref:hypothetical protein n=1 Tax=Anaeropeptidivorans aminofermentans TaxID=2934315 RepID=UPI0020256E2D|nr:hypothetical protein [Anaeropeptidivorans aminofermentans]MBE6012954.1 hypothetical protein [Lachnospiraceae bacterium]
MKKVELIPQNNKRIVLSLLFFLLLISIFYISINKESKKKIQVEMKFDETVPESIYGYIYNTENNENLSEIILEKKNNENLNNTNTIFDIITKSPEAYTKLIDDNNIAIVLEKENFELPHSFKYLYYKNGESKKGYFLFNNDVIFKNSGNKTGVSYMYEKYK